MIRGYSKYKRLKYLTSGLNSFIHENGYILKISNDTLYSPKDLNIYLITKHYEILLKNKSLLPMIILIKARASFKTHIS